MPTSDPSARREAWIVTFLLAATLAAAASFGVNHAFDSARARYAHCREARIARTPGAAVCGGSLPGTQPARPGTVWVFAALAGVLVVCAGSAGVSAARVRPLGA